MALIVETGAGLPDAESYLSVAGADAYHANNGAPAAWTAAPTPEKEAALREATRWLDGTFKLRWGGYRKLWTQRLDWPRTWVQDVDGYTVRADIIPPQVLDATAELALRALAGPLAPDLKRGGAVRSVKVGPIQKEYMPGATPQTIRPAIGLILSRILNPAGMFRQV